MSKLSKGIDLARALAEKEARSAAFAVIRPEHLWIALCNFGADARPECPGPGEATPLRAELAQVAHWFNCRHYDAAVQRLALRRLLGRGLGAPEKLHDSLACQAIFEAADKLAEAGGSPETTLVHLAEALVQEPPKMLGLLLAQPEITGGAHRKTLLLRSISWLRDVRPQGEVEARMELMLRDAKADPLLTLFIDY